MTTLTELGRTVAQVTAQMQKIIEGMSKYRKLIAVPKTSWGEPQFEAWDFWQEVEKELKKIKLAYEAYTRPDLQAVYAKKDFTAYASEIRSKAEDFGKRYEIFKKTENTPFTPKTYPHG